MAACRRIQIDPYLPPRTKLNSKWTKDLNLRLDTLNMAAENVRNSLELTGTEKDFLNRTPKALALKIHNEYMRPYGFRRQKTGQSDKEAA